MKYDDCCRAEVRKCARHFLKNPKMAKSKRLYELLGIDENATTRDIVKAYRITALKTHPDKLGQLSEEDRQVAKESFIQLQHAYDILRDEEKRRNYDLYGWEGEEDAMFSAAYEFYKERIKEEDIVDFSKTYKESKMEQDDLLEFYAKHDGNLSDILLYIPLSDAKDLKRFVNFFNEKITNKELESTKAFEDSSQSDKLKTIEKKYKKMMKKESKASNDDLVAQIMANKNRRENAFSSLIENLESKYKRNRVSLSLSVGAE
ncbi:bifunctional DnaJ domain/Chaperone J-domain superfamily/Chaperone protein AtJ6-like/DnaJ domain [Babesia duncani]|uniref:Bifunctional DnaJ domain/Chaperone J-domain superfamily/Chaperone protein AtJ6-like/DnaJ domain n=1 Tax=Babesia duncani TaxID=323732 RepID=A0AAD9PNM8_9APIC|nr:bifunctional DnaJ domain/Chaperone J-domain superfamily/Chaperone protein AtJ6-like/DnaJ domain [Babesia duncani]